MITKFRTRLVSFKLTRYPFPSLRQSHVLPVGLNRHIALFYARDVTNLRRRRGAAVVAHSPIGNDTTTPPGRQNLCHNNQPWSGMMEGVGNGREGSRERRRVTTYKEGELQSVATGSLLNLSWVWWYSDAGSKARSGLSRFTQQAFTALLAVRWPRSLGSEWLKSQELRTERTGLVEGCGVD